MDDLRLLLMREPRGHGAMSGAILQPPTRDDADWGVLFIEVSGCLPMCGHGTIGVATVLVETGMVEVREPETVVRLDTPAGLVEVRVAVEGGRARSVTLRNVPGVPARARSEVEVPGLGTVRYDMAFGGNFYALVPAADAGWRWTPRIADELIDRGAADHGGDQRGRPARPPRGPADRRLPHVVFHGRGATAPTRAPRPRSHEGCRAASRFRHRDQATLPPPPKSCAATASDELTCAG